MTVSRALRIEVKDMARSRRVYTKRRAFRAGIEGTSIAAFWRATYW